MLPENREQAAKVTHAKHHGMINVSFCQQGSERKAKHRKTRVNKGKPAPCRFRGVLRLCSTVGASVGARSFRGFLSALCYMQTSASVDIYIGREEKSSHERGGGYSMVSSCTRRQRGLSLVWVGTQLANPVAWDLLGRHPSHWHTGPDAAYTARLGPSAHFDVHEPASARRPLRAANREAHRAAIVLLLPGHPAN